MKAFRKFLAPLLMMLAVFGLGGGVLSVTATPAYAQGNEGGGGGSPSVGDMMWNYLSNKFSATPTSMRQVYNDTEAALNEVGCWGCKVFNSFSATTFTAGKGVSDSAAPVLSGVIVAVASLFSLFYIGSSFVSGDASDLLSRWKTFWMLCITVAVGTAWLTAGDGAFNNTWKYVYRPLMLVPMGVADAVKVGAPVNTAKCGAAVMPDGAAAAGADKVITGMYNVVCGGHLITVKGIAFGMALSNSGSGLIGSLVNFFAGFGIIIIFVWVMISFPLRFIDVLLRLTVVGIVTPVLVVCAVFKPTRGYVQIGIRNVLYAGFLFAFTAIMFKIGSQFFEAAVDRQIENIPGSMSIEGNLMAGSLIASSMELVGSGIIFAAMLKMAPALASEFSQFSGSSGGGAGDAATGAAAAAVTMPVKGAAAVVAMKAGGGIVGGSVAKSIGKGVTSADGGPIKGGAG